MLVLLSPTKNTREGQPVSRDRKGVSYANKY
nr:MAG TPA: hypothetical protein [Caudoviricetes sp.]